MNAPFKLVVAIALCGRFSVSAWAESGDTTIKRKVVESSTIVSAGYLPGIRVLEIEFQSGAVYRFEGVPKKVFTAFTKAPSKGRFFGSEIRGKYSFEKMNGASR